MRNKMTRRTTVFEKLLDEVFPSFEWDEWIAVAREIYYRATAHSHWVNQRFATVAEWLLSGEMETVDTFKFAKGDFVSNKHRDSDNDWRFGVVEEYSGIDSLLIETETGVTQRVESSGVALLEFTESEEGVLKRALATPRDTRWSLRRNIPVEMVAPDCSDGSDGSECLG